MNALTNLRISFVLAWLLASAAIGTAQAPPIQTPLDPLRRGLAEVNPAVTPTVRAISGDPWSIVQIDVPLSQPVLGQPAGELQVAELGGKPDGGPRVLYPVSVNVTAALTAMPSQQPLPRIGGGRLLNRVGNLVRELAGSGDDKQQTVGRQLLFLLRGNAPATLRVYDGRGTDLQVNVAPVSDPSRFDDGVQRWWQEYLGRAKSRMDAAEHPAWIETYLVAMLSGRLQLPLPPWMADDLETLQPDDNALIETAKWLTGNDAVRQQMFRRAALGRGQMIGRDGANQIDALPLPPEPTRNATRLRPDTLMADGDEIEWLARHTPPECFYLRYGSFENYLWFKDLSQEYGGDLSQMLLTPSLQSVGAARVERQLGVKSTAMTRLLGPTVILDQAIIGRDLFMTDGASIGVLMHAGNAYLLRTSLQRDRAALAASREDVTLETVDIGGVRVEFMHSPDNSVRSFLVQSGDVFLLTNSRTIARRFLEVSRDAKHDDVSENETQYPSLADTPAFAAARQAMPLSREDTIFLYVSPEMLHGLLSPETLIGLRRRMHASVETSLFEIARLAARGHGESATDIGSLIEMGYLPNTFGQRPDGSGLFEVNDSVIDSMRGRRGTFLPLADESIENVTGEESRWYADIAAAYSRDYPSLDPIFVGVRREAVRRSGSVQRLASEGADARVDEDDTGEILEGRERLLIHAEIAPWQREQYGWWAEQLGPPTDVTMQFAPDDIIRVQAHVASESLGPPTHMFVGIKDTVPPDPEQIDGLLDKYRAIKQVPGYLGAWPQPGALDRLPLGIGRGQPVGPNLTRLIGGVFRYTGGGFSILSFDPQILSTALPHLAAVQADREIQLQIEVGNVVGSQLEAWINQQLYERSKDSCRNTLQLLQTVTTQLHVPPSQTINAVERIFDQTPVRCLDGKLVYDDARQHWVAAGSQPVGSGDAVTQQALPVIAPASYRAPILKWFRGGQAALTEAPNRLILDAEVDLEHQR